jgi:hypothetical protein
MLKIQAISYRFSSFLVEILQYLSEKQFTGTSVILFSISTCVACFYFLFVISERVTRSSHKQPYWLVVVVVVVVVTAPAIVIVSTTIATVAAAAAVLFLPLLFLMQLHIKLSHFQSPAWILSS